MNANVRMPMDARAVSDVDDAELEVVVCRTLPDIMQAMAVRASIGMRTLAFIRRPFPCAPRRRRRPGRRGRGPAARRSA